jgi:ribosome recycling factor
MGKAVAVFSGSITGICSSTVSAGVIDTIKVPCYGNQSQIKHIAYASKVGNSIYVDPFDSALTESIAKSLVAAGFSAYAFSKTRVVVSIPAPSGDEKKKIIAHVNKLAEEAKIVIRNIRKNYRQKLDKEALKTEDKSIQKITDAYIAEIDGLASKKIKLI